MWRIRSPWLVLSGGAITLALTTGAEYSFGVYLEPLAAAGGWSRAAVSGLVSAQLLSWAVFAPLAGWLADRYRPGYVLTAGVGLVGLGQLLAAAFSHSLALMYLFYGAVAGIGLSALFGPAVTAVAAVFRERRGLALGCMAAANGIGYMVGIPVTRWLLEHLGWRAAMAVPAGLVALLGIPAGLVVAWSRAEAPAADPAAAPADRPAAIGAGWTLDRCLRTRSLRVILLNWVLIGAAWVGVQTHLYSFLTGRTVPPATAAAVAGSVGLFHMVGALAAGSLADRVGRPRVLLLTSGLMIAGLAGVALLPAVPVVIWAYAAASGCAFGGTSSTNAGLMPDLFPGPAVARLLSLADVAWGMGAMTGPWLAGYLYDRTGTYAPAFLLFALMWSAVLIGALVLRSEAAGSRFRHNLQRSNAHG